jgi:hypothetical protein
VPVERDRSGSLPVVMYIYLPILYILCREKEGKAGRVGDRSESGRVELQEDFAIYSRSDPPGSQNRG